VIEASAKKDIGKFSLSADLRDGGFICLVGRNGSGKSTFLRTISGQLRIDEGFVKVGGTDVTRLPPEKRGIVLVTPGSAIPHLDVDAHLRLGARLRKLRVDDARLERLKTELGIDFSGKARTLSLGMKERLSLATAIVSSPRAILVDEAFSNLHERRDFISTYRRLAQESGIDVVFSSQDESDAPLADHVYAIADGRTEKRS
jgi:molybdate/tungstate transport system ATP-binding protein